MALINLRCTAVILSAMGGTSDVLTGCAGGVLMTRSRPKLVQHGRWAA